MLLLLVLLYLHTHLSFKAYGYVPLLLSKNALNIGYHSSFRLVSLHFLEMKINTWYRNKVFKCLTEELKAKINEWLPSLKNNNLLYL